MQRGHDAYDRVPSSSRGSAIKLADPEVSEVKPVHQMIAIGRDWNAAFQELSAKRALDDSEQRLQRIREMRKLHQEFAAVSLKVGQQIIQELHLPLEQKTIRPCNSFFNNGPQPEPKTLPPASPNPSSFGSAGGLKYVYEPEGLFFKFSVDSHGLYGGDEFSMKAAGHELRSVMEFIDCCVEGICFPSMVLIDYRGYRLMAMPILPIHPSGFENSTLIYGSADAGVTIHNSDKDFALRLKLCCQMLNLKPHRVFPKSLIRTHFSIVQPFLPSEEPSDSDNDDTEAPVLPPIKTSRSVSSAGDDPLGLTGYVMSGPVDIEGHLGTDGRYYVLDTHRTFPPTTPSPNTQGCYLYQLFRPEFVKNYRMPLCSDAFASWIMDERKEHEAEIREATQYLLTRIVPATALLIETNFAAPGSFPLGGERSPRSPRLSPASSFEDLVIPGLHPAQLLLIAHSRGVNVRYLGYIRSHMTSPGHRMIMMTEIVARTMKNLIRGRMRAVNSSLDSAFLAVIVNTLNQVMGTSADALSFWRDPLRLKGSVLKRFPRALDQTELDVSFDFRETVSLPMLLERLQSLLAIEMEAIPADHLGHKDHPYPIATEHILKISPISKTLHRLAYEEGVAFSHAGVKHSEGADSIQSNQHFEKAARKYGEALLIKPNAIRILHNWALSLTYQAATKSFPESLHMLSVAAQKLTSCLSFDPNDGYGLFLWGNILIDVAKIVSANPAASVEPVISKLEQTLLGLNYPGENLDMAYLWQLLWSNASSSQLEVDAAYPQLDRPVLLAPKLSSVRICPCYWNLFACIKYLLASQCKNKPPRYHRLLFNWGNALVALGQNDYIPQELRMAFITRSIEKYEHSNDFKATVPNLRNWAVALSRLARIETSDALAEQAFARSEKVFEECAELRPNDPISHFNWGNMCFRRAIFYRNRSRLAEAHANFRDSVAKYEESLEVGDFERAAFVNWGIAICEILKIRHKLDPAPPPLADALQLVGDFLAFFEKALLSQTASLSMSSIATMLEAEEPQVKEFIRERLTDMLQRIPKDNALTPQLQQMLTTNEHTISLKDLQALKQSISESDQSEYVVRHSESKREYRLKRFRISAWNRSLRIQHLEPSSPSTSLTAPSFDGPIAHSGGTSTFPAFLGVLSHCIGPLMVHSWELSKEYILLLELFAEKDLLFQLSLMAPAKREEVAIYYIFELALIVRHLHAQEVYVGYLDPRGIVLSSKGHACIAHFHLTRSRTHMSELVKHYDPSIPIPPELKGNPASYSKKTDLWYLGILFQMIFSGSAKPSTDLTHLSGPVSKFLEPFFALHLQDRPTLTEVIASPLFYKFESVKGDLENFRKSTQPPLHSLAHQNASEDQTFGTIVSNRSEGSFHGNTYIVPR